MSALITSVEHALATAASDTVKVAKFVETGVLPVLKTAKADESTIEAVTALVSPQAANIERAGFAVLGVVINALDGHRRRQSRARCPLRLPRQNRRLARHPLTRPDKTLRKVPGLHADDVVSFIH
jgi:hypothetical protein